MNDSKKNDLRYQKRWLYSGGASGNMFGALVGYRKAKKHHNISETFDETQGNYVKDGKVHFGVLETTYKQSSPRTVTLNGLPVMVLETTMLRETRDFGNEEMNWVLVPGYVKSTQGNISEVVPLNQSEKSELVKKIAGEVKGHINFW